MQIKYCKLFLDKGNIGFKWDMTQFYWVKTIKQKGITFPAPKR